eukprot:6491330-Amphidinium_carterae.1
MARAFKDTSVAYAKGNEIQVAFDLVELDEAKKKHYHAVLSKANATFNEIVLIQLIEDKDVSVAERQQRTQSVLRKLEATDKTWGGVKSQMQAQIFVEANSVLSSFA